MYYQKQKIMFIYNIHIIKQLEEKKVQANI